MRPLAVDGVFDRARLARTAAELEAADRRRPRARRTALPRLPRRGRRRCGFRRSAPGRTDAPRPPDALDVVDQAGGGGRDLPALGARPARARRSGCAAHPRVRTGRQGAGHRPAPPHPHRRSPHARHRLAGGRLGRHRRARLRPAPRAALGAGAQGRLPPGVELVHSRRAGAPARRAAVRSATCARRSSSPSARATAGSACPRQRYRDYGARIAPMFDVVASTEAGQTRRRERRQRPRRRQYRSRTRRRRRSASSSRRREATAADRSASSPGFYRMLLAGGSPRGRRLLRRETVEALAARHRVGLIDATFRARLDWGLGVIVNSAHYGEPEMPYGYGPFAGPRTFGHSGARSSTAFADPDAGLVVALAVNGMPADDRPSPALRAPDGGALSRPGSRPGAPKRDRLGSV